MADITIKRNDQLPSVRATLYDPNGAIDLTDTSVRFRFRSRAKRTLIISGDCSIDSPQTAGKVTYSWRPADTAVAGLYDAEFEITKDGQKITCPNTGMLSLEIVQSNG